MPWTDKPGGPGRNGANNGPWGRPQNEDDRRPTGGGRGSKDLEDLLRSGRDRFRRGTGGGNRGGGSGSDLKMPSPRMFLFGLIGLFVIWLLSGIYTVQPGSRGVVTTFGNFAKLSEPGINWHLPWPIQATEVVQTDLQREATVGQGQGGKFSMLTSDLNIVDADMTVVYRIRDEVLLEPGELPNAAKFLFNIENPERLVRSAAESALREVVGANQFEPIISRGRTIVSTETRLILQAILDRYDSGIEVTRVDFGEAEPPTEVKPDQADLVNARSEAERRVNQANGYYNREVPQAEGRAERTLLEAQAYAAQAVAQAYGQAERFNNIYGEYVQAPSVTRERLYLETMERVLGDMNKVVIDEGAGGMLPYLNLNELVRDGQNSNRSDSSSSSNVQRSAPLTGQSNSPTASTSATAPQPQSPSTGGTGQ